MKLTKGKIIAAVVVLCVLIGAFFLGGGTSGGDDRNVPAATQPMETQTTETSLPEETTAPDVTETVVPETASPAVPEETKAVEETPKPTQPPSPEPTQAPASTPTAAPSPEPTAAPESTPESTAAPEPEPLTCTLTISCTTILNNMDKLTPGKEELIPDNGWLLGPITAEFTEGESVFDVLKRELQARNLHFEYTTSAMYDTAYIEGICNIYEYDCGELSGWQYSVNGMFPSYGCGQYTLSDGDVIAWVYTCDLGADVGNGY